MGLHTGKMIGHLDADCFYVSCERVRFSGLRGKPVGVLGNQGACIIAKSYELRARGVKTGIPIWESHELCPDAIYVKRDFHWYEVLSRKMLAITREISPSVEYYSIDELFFDASSLPQAFHLPMSEACKALQDRMMREVGIPVSIGVAPTKMLAKLTSDTHKPQGCGVVRTEGERWQLLHDLPVDEITGIARKSRARLESHGISTCEHFAKADRTLIRRILTKRGEDLWWEMNGVSVLPLCTERPCQKSIARGGSLGGKTNDADRLRAWIARNTERLLEALDHSGVYCSRVALFLGFAEGFGTIGHADLLEPSAQFEEIHPVILALFAAAWKSQEHVSYMHVFGEKLQCRTSYQTSMFSKKNPHTLDHAAIMRLVNQRVGRFAIRTGSTLPLKDIYADASQSYDICDVQGKLCF